MAKSTIQLALFFCWLSLVLVVWLRSGDPFVSQNPREVSLGHILCCALPFVPVFKFKLLAQFSVDHFLHPVMCGLILFFALICCIRLLCDWSFPTKPTFAILLHLIYSCFDLVLIALFWAASWRDLVSLQRFHFLSHVQVFSCEISLVCHLKRPYSYFFPHFCSADPCVVCIVSTYCNLSSFVLFM